MVSHSVNIGIGSSYKAEIQTHHVFLKNVFLQISGGDVDFHGFGGFFIGDRQLFLPIIAHCRFL